MIKKFKKLTACALVTMLCLSATMSYPVHATEIDQNTDTGETKELDENAVPMDNTDTVENETNVQESENNPEPEQNLTKENNFSDNTGETTPQDTLETMLGSEPVMAATEIVTQAGDFQVVNGKNGQEWTYDKTTNTLTFNKSGMYEVRGNGQPTTERIIISDCAFNGTITLTNVHIDVSSQPYAAAFEASNRYNNTKVSIILQEKNTLKSGPEKAGLLFNNDKDSSALTISGNGSLNVTGGSYSAGIGGTSGRSVKNITINGGEIIASSGNAAIGGGNGGAADNITINGGTIHAISSNHGAAIGGGENCSGTNITINGGNVTVSAKTGAGIGGSARALGTNITINGGTVTAKSESGAGIGGGYLSNGSSNIVITGGSVKTSGGRGGIDSTPTDGRGENVFLAKLGNQNGNNKVSVANSNFTRAGNHSDGDTDFYLYLAGKTHNLSANGVQYKAIWNQNNSSFSIQPPAPAVDIDSQTASSITVKEPAYAGTYGNAQYRIDGGSWQDSRVFENLKSDTSHTIEVKYIRNNSFTESDIGRKENIKTKQATYIITIPQKTLTAGNESSKNEMSVDTNNFDLGYGGKVDVKVSKTDSISSDGKLTLTRQQATETITSALLVDSSSFTDINNPVATFTMDNKDSEKVSISFAKPAETEILAGTYSGTITFKVSYSEP